MHQELQGICRRENSFLNWLGITIVAMFASFGRNRLPWLILAVVLMFASAICGLLYMDAVGKISGWIGVPGLEFEGKVSRLQWYAGLWSGLALIFPFLAALLLGLGKGTRPSHAETSRTSVITSPEVSDEWTAVTAIFTYLLRVALSALASLAFMVLFILVVVLLEKLGVRAHCLSSPIPVKSRYTAFTPMWNQSWILAGALTDPSSRNLMRSQSFSGCKVRAVIS